jgi:hypothetical protein
LLTGNFSLLILYLHKCFNERIANERFIKTSKNSTGALMVSNPRGRVPFFYRLIIDLKNGNKMNKRKFRKLTRKKCWPAWSMQ